MATMTFSVVAAGNAPTRTPQEVHGIVERISAKPVGSVNGSATLQVRAAQTLNTHEVLAATAANVAFDKYRTDFASDVMWVSGKFLEVTPASADNGDEWTVEIDFIEIPL